MRNKRREHSSHSHKSSSSHPSISSPQIPSVNPSSQEASSVEVAPSAPQALPVAESSAGPRVSPFFSLYGRPLSEYEPVPQRWLWPGRIPLGTITLLDGDLGTGKSLLSQQIAAHVSAGNPLPDGSETIKGGVVIVAPHEAVRNGMYMRLNANGADMERIRVLSFVHDQNADGATLPDSYRPFQLPDDLHVLRATMQQLDARLVIIDPFLSILPKKKPFHEWQLPNLLLQLNMLMMELDATCLLTRQCPPRSGLARPSSLERSSHFICIAASRFLLAHDPLEPERFLLAQATCRLHALSPTITFSLASPPEMPHLPRLIYQGPHQLKANDLLTYPPATLARQLLCPRICALLVEASGPVSLDTLREHFPYAVSSQLQRTLNYLVQVDMITRLAGDLYALAPTIDASILTRSVW